MFHTCAAFPGHRLVIHRAVAMGIIIEHRVVVGGGVCDHTHEEGDQRLIVNESEEEWRVYGEVVDGARSDYNRGGGRFYSFFAEFHGCGMTDTRHPEGLDRDPREVRTRKQRTESCKRDPSRQKRVVNDPSHVDILNLTQLDLKRKYVGIQNFEVLKVSSVQACPLMPSSFLTETSI